MIKSSGWSKYNSWEQSSNLRNLYARRCNLESEEMTCAAQAIEILAPYASKGDSLLDIGCGSGYFYHSIASRNMEVEYWGIDATLSLLEIGRSILPKYGLPVERLIHCRIEDLDADKDHVLCMNVLSNIDNYQRPLERLLLSTRKTLILRESVSNNANYLYVKDKYLDAGVDLKVHINTYLESEFVSFIEDYGFEVETFIDRRTGGKPEMIIDYPHHWKFFRATKTKE